jgi:hypothetical protein
MEVHISAKSRPSELTTDQSSHPVVNPAPITDLSDRSETSHSSDQSASVPATDKDQLTKDEDRLTTDHPRPSCQRNRRVASPFVKGQIKAPSILHPARTRPRTGKIANLPDDLREWVSNQILDEVPYDEILDTLAAEGHADINDQNITNWKSGGYLEWLKARNVREERTSQLEVITDYVRQNRGSVEEAALLVVANQLLDIVGDFDVALIKEELTKDPQTYIKVIQALTRLKKVRQAFQKNCQSSLDIKPSHRDAEGLFPESERGLTEETLKKITTAIKLF